MVQFDETGRFYRTLDGRKAWARLSPFDLSDDDFSAIGFIEDTPDSAETWASDGKFYSDDKESGLDIVALWTEPGEPREPASDFLRFTRNERPIAIRADKIIAVTESGGRSGGMTHLHSLHGLDISVDQSLEEVLKVIGHESQG